MDQQAGAANVLEEEVAAANICMLIHGLSLGRLS